MQTQPPGLSVLFFTELWERFSYYGMRALLVLFLITAPEQGGFGWSTADATQVYGWYTGLVYLTPIVGGYIADRYLGPANAVVLGGMIIALGHFSLALATKTSFYLGLLAIIVGTGFFKSNISTMVGGLYAKADPARDAGFTLFYMGINLGALLGPLVCGYLAQRPDFGWHYGFGAAGIGMLLGLAVFMHSRLSMIKHSRLHLDSRRYSNNATLSPEEWGHLRALGILVFFVVFFWLAFEQTGTSLTLFAEKHTDRTLPYWLHNLSGLERIPTPWFQSVNPAFILLLAPIFSSLWKRLALRGMEPDSFWKMVWGLSFLAGGFVIMVLGSLSSDAGSLVTPWFLVGAYLFHTCGELCLSPVGLSLVSKLAPRQLAAMVMGIWFLANFFANVVSGYIAGSLERVETGALFRILGGQADFYAIFVVSSAAAALALAALIPYLRRLARGV